MSKINILDELHNNFVDYAYEVNSQRSFPSALDGLKPGQRACLWEMFVKGFSSNKPHVKSAKISGSVIAELWPHSNDAIYETFVRMSQPWVNNIALVDWHGANGSIKGGPDAASERYTEARLAKVAEDAFFTNVKKDAVDFIPNFSEDVFWPEVFPALFPVLGVNGSTGIGYTLANNWLPNNLNELTEKVKEFIKTKKVSTSGIYPDFPTGGIIVNKSEIESIYKTGLGKCVLRGVASIEGNVISITELPYQIYVEPFVNEIKDSIASGKITGIKDVINKCDKNNLLIEIECDSRPELVLQKLYKSTDLEITLNANQYAMITKVPVLLNLQEYIKAYVNHNLDCLKREYEFDLKKAQERLEIVVGLLKALIDIDKIIKLIKGSKDSAEAKVKLMKLKFTERQAQAILDMRLARLAHLESIELEQEKKELEKNIKNLESLIKSPTKLKNEFLKRLEDFTTKYGWKRRTKVEQVEEVKIDFEDTVEDYEATLFTTELGYVKKVLKVSDSDNKVKDGDKIVDSFAISNKDEILFWTDKQNCYKLYAYQLKECKQNELGDYVRNILELESDEKVIYTAPLYSDKFVLYGFKNGKAARIPLSVFETKFNRKKLINAMNTTELLGISVCAEDDVFMFETSEKRKIYFKAGQVSLKTTKNTQGIQAINLLKKDNNVVSFKKVDKVKPEQIVKKLPATSSK